MQEALLSLQLTARFFRATHFLRAMDVLSPEPIVRWAPCHQGMARPQVADVQPTRGSPPAGDWTWDLQFDTKMWMRPNTAQGSDLSGFCSPNIVRTIKSRIITCNGYIVYIGKKRNVY
jgi:hypothetical protein